ncbi:hypothetical protein OsI_23129 [Oryza sativa Indica Group]|uniref:Uncharacterized protein n=1 Tax=Oryza sativa subsp. indica TaxID=39946 RepID=B8B323_ORYSI|nr:hypothetical protein OsI_23129 [Oryza sativa Indica Group]
MRLPASSSSAAGLQERIWDLHDNLSHAILSLSASAHRCCRRRAPEGRVVVKGWRRQGGCGDCGLEQEAAAAATMADARSLHAVRAALEDLEGHLHFLHMERTKLKPHRCELYASLGPQLQMGWTNIQLRQVAERDAAIARLQQSRILLATRLAEHRWKKHEVIEEALAFVDDALDKSRFVSPEDVRGTHTHSQSVENQCPKIHDSNFLVRFLSCTLAIAKNSLRFERIGGALGNTAMFAVSMLAFLQLQQVAFGKQTPAVQCRRVNYFHSQMSVKNTKEKHLVVLLARG